MLAEMKPSAFARHYPEGQARNTAIARHATAKIRQQHEQMGFHEGGGIVLDQLGAYAKGLKGGVSQCCWATVSSDALTPALSRREREKTAPDIPSP